MAHNRKCIVDLTEYKYCPHCGDNPDETWRFIYCSENCRGIDKVMQGFVSGRLSELEAQEELKNYDVDMNKVCKSTKELLEKIYSVKAKEEIEETIKEETKEDAESDVKSEEVPVLVLDEVVPKYKNKRKKPAVIEEKIDE